MALTPLDIHNKEFPNKFRGYDPDSVDEFLNQIIREFELLIKENAHLKEQLDHQNSKLEQYRNLEETINKTLVVAQETAEEIKTNARRDAELTIQEGRLQAERIVEAGQAKARRILEENSDLVRVVQVLRIQIRSLLESQLSAIEGLEHRVSDVAPGLIPDLSGGERRLDRIEEPKAENGQAAPRLDQG